MGLLISFLDYSHDLIKTKKNLIVYKKDTLIYFIYLLRQTENLNLRQKTEVIFRLTSYRKKIQYNEFTQFFIIVLL